MQMVMTSNETRIQTFRLANVTYKTHDKGQQEKCHIVAVIRKLRTDKNCPAAKSLRNHVMSGISDLKRPTAPIMVASLNTMMQRTAHENAAGFQRSYLLQQILCKPQYVRLRSFESLCF